MTLLAMTLNRLRILLEVLREPGRMDNLEDYSRKNGQVTCYISPSCTYLLMYHIVLQIKEENKTRKQIEYKPISTREKKKVKHN